VSDFVDAAAPPVAPAADPLAPAPIARETFVEGSGFRPAPEDARDVATDGEGFRARPAGGRDVMYDGRATTRLLPPALLAKLQEGWGERPAAAPAAAPVAAAAPPAAPATEPAVPVADAAPAAPAEPAKPADAPPAPPPDLAELTAARDRLSAQNAKLLADLETARAPVPSARSKVDEAADDYIDDPETAIRHVIARALGLDDPQHAEVTAELDALIPDLTAKRFAVPLDATQQASRDAAKVRQALTRDKRSRKAESDAAAKAQTAIAEQAKVDQAATVIGNRLSLARTASDGKPAPSWREAYPLSMSMAQRLSGMPPERLVATVIQQGLATGRYDQARAGDDEYLLASALGDIESDYQSIADSFGKARPAPTLSPPQASPPSTASPPPAPAPAASTSASQVPPQGHGGRTLTQADSSVAPATPPSTPAPAPTQPSTRKLLSRKAFLDQRYGNGR
jgi:hypothetical protein